MSQEISAHKAKEGVKSVTDPQAQRPETAAAASSTPLEWTMRLGPSTKVATLTTGERIRFTRQALDSVVEKSRGKYLPQGLEHLNYLPPIGRIVEMYVEEGDDGEAYLFARAIAARAGIAGDIKLPRQASTDTPQLGAEAGPTFSVSYEPRNFVADDVRTIDKTAPLEVRHQALHADLPPLIWALTVSGGLGLGWASKSFLEAFLSKLGEVAGGSLTDWLVRSARRAKAAQRTNLVEVRLETTTGVRVTAICPFSPTIGEEVERLRAGLAALGDVAIFCRSLDEGKQPEEMRAATFMWDGTNWRLAWWASDEGVFTTPWFRQNLPDPQQFLGRPLQTGLEALDAMLDGGGASIGGLSPSPEVVSADFRQAAPPHGD